MEWALPALVAVCLVLVASAGLAAYALHLAITTRIEVRALQNSTHSVQMVPIDSPDALSKADDELEQAMTKADDRLFEDMDEIHQRTDALM